MATESVPPTADCEFADGLENICALLDPKVLTLPTFVQTLEKLVDVAASLATLRLFTGNEAETWAIQFKEEALTFTHELVERGYQFVLECQQMAEDHSDGEAILQDLDTGGKSELEAYLKALESNLKNCQQCYDAFIEHCKGSKAAADEMNKLLPSQKKKAIATEKRSKMRQKYVLGAESAIFSSLGTFLYAAPQIQALCTFVTQIMTHLSQASSFLPAIFNEAVTSAISPIAATCGVSTFGAVLLIIGGVIGVLCVTQLLITMFSESNPEILKTFEQAEMTTKLLTTSMNELKRRLLTVQIQVESVRKSFATVDCIRDTSGVKYLKTTIERLCSRMHKLSTVATTPLERLEILKQKLEKKLNGL